MIGDDDAASKDAAPDAAPDASEDPARLGRAETRRRRAWQPLWNALDDAFAQVVPAVLAVSGGPDSRALLEAWGRWPRRGPAVVVVVDHGQRAGSADEARAVVAAATAAGLDAVAVVVNVAHGDEQTLRRARYAALFEVARDRGIAVVVTAHHRGDVAEGLLLHLAGRGGGRGGAAPHVVENRIVGGWDARLVRPFLGLSKETLRTALDAAAIVDVVVDEDDEAGKNARGWLRRHLLEPLGEQRADIEEALARHARQRREDDDVLSAMLPENEGDEVDGHLAPALLRRWLQRRLRQFSEDPRTAGAAIDDVLRLCAAGTAGSVDVRGGRAVISRQGNGVRLRVTRR